MGEDERHYRGVYESMIYSVYSGSEILRVERTDQLLLTDGESFIVGDYPPSDYYMIGVLPMPRPDFDLTFNAPKDADGIFQLPDVSAVFRIDGIPASTRIVDPSGDFIESDGWYEASFTHSGRFIVALTLFPYKELEVYVEA